MGRCFSCTERIAFLRVTPRGYDQNRRRLLAAHACLQTATPEGRVPGLSRFLCFVPSQRARVLETLSAVMGNRLAIALVGKPTARGPGRWCCRIPNTAALGRSLVAPCLPTRIGRTLSGSPSHHLTKACALQLLTNRVTSYFHLSKSGYFHLSKSGLLIRARRARGARTAFSHSSTSSRTR